jgi:hypothetical protein
MITGKNGVAMARLREVLVDALSRLIGLAALAP